jgi:serine/threonine protein kinase
MAICHFKRQNYEILGLIGRGGFANVYKAKETRTGATHALKIVSFNNVTQSVLGIVVVVR